MGFYKCVDTGIVAEFITHTIPFKYERIFIKFKAYPNKLKDQYGDEYNFVPFEHKPDSTNNWLKNHRKYRLGKK